MVGSSLQENVSNSIRSGTGGRHCWVPEGLEEPGGLGDPQEFQGVREAGAGLVQSPQTGFSGLSGLRDLETLQDQVELKILYPNPNPRGGESKH